MAAPNELGVQPCPVKYQWNTILDGHLVSSLHHLFTLGTWKCDTGFKPGYLQLLEKLMNEKLPGCGAKATPHIESRVKILKRQTMAIFEMLQNGIGFAWNDADKTVVCEKVVFDDWAKSHPNAKGLFGKAFPHYDTLVEIFAKDRANGKEATTLAAEEEALDEADADPTEVLPQVDEFDGVEFSSAPAQPSPSADPTVKCRKTAETGFNCGLQQVFASLERLVDGSLGSFDKIGTTLTVESANEREIANEIQKIEGLTLVDILEAGKKIAHDGFLSAIFLSLSEDKRKEMMQLKDVFVSVMAEETMRLASKLLMVEVLPYM